MSDRGVWNGFSLLKQNQNAILLNSKNFPACHVLQLLKHTAEFQPLTHSRMELSPS
jgi:hypothetical protein